MCLCDKINFETFSINITPPPMGFSLFFSDLIMTSPAYLTALISTILIFRSIIACGWCDRHKSSRSVKTSRLASL